MKIYVRFLFVLLPLSLMGYTQEDVTDFTSNYGYIAVRQSIDYDIPASIILAQAFLESRHGTSDLAVQYNNFFGIKSKRNWDGGAVLLRSAEYHHHRRIVKTSKFRYYATPEDSWRDHSEFLASGPRYRKLFALGSMNYRGWARGLQRAGYATDPNYAKKLIRLIERHHFHDFDRLAVLVKYNRDIVMERFDVANRESIAVCLERLRTPMANVRSRDLLNTSPSATADIQSVVAEARDDHPLKENVFYIYLSDEDEPVIKEVALTSLRGSDVEM